MSNPDSEPVITKTHEPSLLVSSLIGLLFFFITKYIVSYINVTTTMQVIIIIIGLTLIGYIVSVLYNYAYQYRHCKKINNKLALSGAISSSIVILLGGIVSSISYCRIPIASLFTPLYMNTSTTESKVSSEDINTSSLQSISPVKVCKVTNLTLEYIEERYPKIIGISWGFYLSIAMTIGIMISSGSVIECN